MEINTLKHLNSSADIDKNICTCLYEIINRVCKYIAKYKMYAQTYTFNIGKYDERVLLELKEKGYLIKYKLFKNMTVVVIDNMLLHEVNI